MRIDGKVRLNDVDPSDTNGVSEEKAIEQIEKLGKKIERLQELLFAAGKTPLLIVLQGRDTSGKDGTIRRLLKVLNAQSTRIAPFKVPTPLELSHDFLWRVHQQTPAKGETVIFNRSHYEDVLVVRVHEIVSQEVWKGRFDSINDFEKHLSESGTVILKFFLHISKDEQEKRLIEREEEPEKAWKLNVGDWKEREFWSEYTEAYEDALQKCSTKHAPWYLIPADHKWYRDLLVLETIHDALKQFEDEWMKSLEDLGSKMKKELEIYRNQTIVQP
jgi:PPK2 family polyphosphate:nucleotide phosphotransferase